MNATLSAGILFFCFDCFSDLYLQLRYVVGILFEIVFWFLVGADSLGRIQMDAPGPTETEPDRPNRYLIFILLFILV
jgi:hypothetical protein